MIQILFNVLMVGLGNAQEIIELEGTYQVPVSPTLMEVATFNLSDYRVEKYSETDQRMIFRLPSDLVGPGSSELKFQLTESSPDGKKVLTGEHGRADCVGKWVALNCQFRFENLKLDSDAIASYLKQKYAGDDLLTKRTVVAAAFSVEPIGNGKTQIQGLRCERCWLGDGDWELQRLGQDGRGSFQISLDQKTGIIFKEGYQAPLTEISYVKESDADRLLLQYNHRGIKHWFDGKLTTESGQVGAGASQRTRYTGEWGVILMRKRIKRGEFEANRL